MNNAITIVSKTPITSIKPPPTKAEMIDAMAHLKVEQLEAQQKIDVARREELKKSLPGELFGFFQKRPTAFKRTGSLGWAGTDYPHGMRVDFEADPKKLPKALCAKYREFHKLDRARRDIRFSDVRKEIADAVNQKMPREDRIERLLDDKESRAVLSKLLEALK